MSFELEHFRTRLGKRIVVLFFLCAVIPTATLAVVSYLRVRSELGNQTQERLHQSTTDAAMGVYERLQAIESEMFFLSSFTLAANAPIQIGMDSPIRQDDLRRLSGVTLIPGSGVEPVPLAGSPIAVSELASDVQALSRMGETVLAVVRADDTDHVQILMSRPWDRDDVRAGVVWGRIIPDSLWSTARVYGTSISADDVNDQDEKGFCVLDPSMQPLDCAGNLASWPLTGPPEGMRIQADSLHGALSWTSGGESYSGHYRRVFLKDFNSGSWTIVVGETNEENLATLGDFRGNLIGILVLTLASVLLLAAVQIRHSMEPLAKLRAGTRRIAAQDFTTRVHITSGDEFEELAGSFNDMAHQVGVLFDELDDLNWSTITTLARTIDAKSSWTAGHSERVSDMAVRIARKMGLPEDELIRLYRGGLLHDIGKIGVPVAVLDKQGPLTYDEMEVMKSHVTIGARILEPLKPLADVLPIVLHHHERMDGQGYPHGVAGDEIPHLARILSVADTFDALLSHRPYRAAIDIQDGMSVIVKHAGTQLDPSVVDAFLVLMQSSERDEPPFSIRRTTSDAAEGAPDA